MKKIVKLGLVLTIVTILSTVALGQKTSIKFAPGKTSAVVTGKLTGYKGQRIYVIRVRAGQMLKTEDIGKNHITLGIDGPPGSNYEQDMAADCHAYNEITPTAAGDYTITVTECQKADRWRGSFRLKVWVK